MAAIKCLKSTKILYPPNESSGTRMPIIYWKYGHQQARNFECQLSIENTDTNKQGIFEWVILLTLFSKAWGI
jgi:hypothetical protein